MSGRSSRPWRMVTRRASRGMAETRDFAPALPSGRTQVWLWRYGAYWALAVLIGFNVAFTPHFVSWQTLNVNLTQVATIVIVGVGMTLVIATGGIDLSVGSLMAISGALAPLIFMSDFGVAHPIIGVALAFVVPVLVAGLLGLFNGWVITPLPVQQLVA